MIKLIQRLNFFIVISILTLLFLVTPIFAATNTTQEATNKKYVNDVLFPIEVDGKWGFIDYSGKIVIKPQFDEVGGLSNGLIRVKVNEVEDGQETGYSHFGFIDRTGKIVIPAEYEFAKDFSEGLAAVLIGDKYGYVDVKGNLIIQPNYERAYNFSEGLARIAETKTFDNGFETETKKQYGFINKTGKLVIATKFDGAEDFKNGVACVATGSRLVSAFGYINKSGSYIIKPGISAIFKYILDAQKGKYANKTTWLEEGYSFNENLALVKINGKYGYINTSGQVAIPEKYDWAFHFTEGFAAVIDNGTLCYINTNGKIALRTNYKQESISSQNTFHSGLAAVKINGKYGFIDKKGKVVIKPQYDSINSFENDLAAVFINEHMSYINTTGKVVYK